MRVARSHFFWMRREDAWARAQRTPSNHTGAIRIGGEWNVDGSRHGLVLGGFLTG